jgi:hypothetical protein
MSFGDTITNRKESMLVKAAFELAKEINQIVDDKLPVEIAEIVKIHSAGAAASGIASGWIPGAGGTAAVAIAAGFIWTMYGRINSKINIPFSENILKSIASAVATNIASAAITSIVLSSAISIVPGLGSVGASILAGSTCYAITLASGIVYIKLLTSVFKAGEDPTLMNSEQLKKAAKTIIDKEDLKKVMKEAKKSFKDAKSNGEIKQKGATNTI